MKKITASIGDDEADLRKCWQADGLPDCFHGPALDSFRLRDAAPGLQLQRGADAERRNDFRGAHRLAGENLKHRTINEEDSKARHHAMNARHGAESHAHFQPEFKTDAETMGRNFEEVRAFVDSRKDLLVVVDLRAGRKHSSGINEINILGVACFVGGRCFVRRFLEPERGASGEHVRPFRRGKDNMARRF